MGIWEYQTTWSAFWEICMQVRKQQLELDMWQRTDSKLGKEHIICHPGYLTYMQSTSCDIPVWMKHKLESRFQGEISIISDTQMTPPPPYSRKQRGTEESLDGPERRGWKSWLQTQPSKNKHHGTGQIVSWQTVGETVEAVRDFKFWDLKIIGDGDYSHESKRCLLLGRKAMTNLGSILKSRNITLLTKVHLVKAMVFPVVMYGCESWTMKKLSAEELMLLSCGVEEDSWESLGLQEYHTTPS